MTNDQDPTPAPNSTDPVTPEKDNLSNLSDDPAHPFDQTNGIVDGLGGDADDRSDDDDDDAALPDPTLSDEATRQRPDEDGRLA